MSLLKSETEAIFSSVKPPKKEEAKKDEPMENTEAKKEGEDVEMKAEEPPAGEEQKAS